VALAAFAAAGLAGTSAIRTGWLAFRLSLVLFLVPFGFAFDPAMLGQGPPHLVALALLSVLVATTAWAFALEGFWDTPLSLVKRGLFAAAAVATILMPTGSMGWLVALVASTLLAAWVLVLRPRRRRVVTT
jgi:TRAP-type uncharacterized transport system fused permease subunit